MLRDVTRLLDALPDPTLLLGPDGRPVHVNPAAAALLPDGASPELFEPDGAPLTEDLRRRALEVGTALGRPLLLREHGHDRLVAARWVPLTDLADHVVLTLVALPDQAELELRAAEESADLLALASSAGRLLAVNDAAERLLGWPKSTLLEAGALWMLLHPADFDRLLQALRAQAPMQDLVTRVRHVSGEWRLISWALRPERGPRGEVTSLRGADVTEKLRREEELVASREALAEAHEIAHIGTITRDLRTGALELSLRARTLFELPDDEHAEAVLLQRLVPDEALDAAVELAWRGESSTVPLRLELPSGPRAFKLWLRPHRSLHGEVVRVVGVAQDVTDEVKLNAQLRLAERLASVGTLAAGVAHEINNPLAFILANLNAVRRELGRVDAIDGVDLADLRSALDEASEGADRVRTIVAGLRAFTRVDETSVTPCDVRRVLEAVLNVSRNEVRHRARVTLELQPVPPVMANEARLAQVFLNLVLNAAQAIVAGRVEANLITVSTQTQGAQVVVRVSDTGTGIEPQHLPRLFDPFFTTKSVGSGTGLGLFISQGIVRELGGDVTVEHTSPSGTTFKVALPAAPAEDAPGVTPARPGGRQLRVLVVDDEPLILRSLQRMLTRECEVVLAHDGREALTLLERAPYDVVLCDLMMPELSGIELWGKLGPEQRRRVVFMSGGTFTEEGRKFLETAQPLQLAKPFSAESVSAVLRSAAGR